MAITYKLTKKITLPEGIIDNSFGTIRSFNSETGAISFIPKSEENTSYQEYLAWVAEGNTPEPADE